MNRLHGSARAGFPAGTSGLLALAAIACWLGVATGVQAQQSEAAVEIRTPVGQPLSAEERERVVDAILGAQEIASLLGKQRVTALRVSHQFEETKGERQPSQKIIASALIFNYSTGSATRYDLDTSTGSVIGREELQGRPQASPEERAEAFEIIRSDTDLARYLGDSGELAGGFVVDPPDGTAADDLRHRFLQIHILSADREDILQFVTVDLTARGIAEAGPAPWKR